MLGIADSPNAGRYPSASEKLRRYQCNAKISSYQAGLSSREVQFQAGARPEWMTYSKLVLAQHPVC